MIAESSISKEEQRVLMLPIILKTRKLIELESYSVDVL